MKELRSVMKVFFIVTAVSLLGAAVVLTATRPFDWVVLYYWILFAGTVIIYFFFIRSEEE